MRTVIAGITMAGILSLVAGTASAALDDAKAQDLMKSAGCAACHTIDKKLIGPPYKDVALKRKGEKDAAGMLEKAVRDGSKGAYGGPIPMPPNPATKISDANLHEMIEWVLTK